MRDRSLAVLRTIANHGMINDGRWVVVLPVVRRRDYTHTRPRR
jgi:hypothetical protein